MKAMLFAAGFGTRLKPFTDKHPKALAIVNGKTLLQRNIEYLKSFGFNEFVINVHYFAEQIENFLEQNNNFGSIIHVLNEKYGILETGGGLVNAKNILKEETFLVMNADILTNMNIDSFIHFHQQQRPLVSLAVSERESSRKLLFDKNKQLKGWRNLTTGEEIIQTNDKLKSLAFSGIHIIEPEIFNFIQQTGKFSIMVSYMELMQSQTILGFDHSGDILIDVGKPESIFKAEEFFK